MNASLWVDKVRHSLAEQGWNGTVRRARDKAFFHLGELRPSRRRAIAERNAADRAFDQKHGVDTAGMIALSGLSVQSESRIHGSTYWAVDPADFREAIASLQIEASGFTFLDLGSGKGRALLLATEFAFAKIVGVEFADELHEAARQNFFGANKHPAADRVQLLCLDAANYEFPDTPLVVFLYHPFGEAITTQVIANMRASVSSSPREVFVVYANPLLRDVWAQSGFLDQTYADERYAVFHRPGPSMP